jgi:hypothetical protein
MTFLALGALWGLALVAPLVVLYLLRPRHQETPVSSLFLWQAALNDRQAHHPLQRFRQSLLFWLQLWVILTLVLALTRPAFLASAWSQGRVVVLMDASMSMNAVGSDGRTRWQAAQDEAFARIGALGLGQTMLVLRVGDTVTTLADTADPFALRAAIAGAEAGQGRADMDTALTLALAQNPADILLISDGVLGTVGALAQGVQPPRVALVGEAGENVSIRAFSTRAHPEGQELFVQVAHEGQAPATFDLLIRLDGTLWQSQRATLAPNAQGVLTFVTNRAFKTAQASLIHPTGADALALDDHAYTVAEAPKSLRVLYVSDGERRFVRQALRSLPNVQLYQAFIGEALPNIAYDLLIAEAYVPTELPPAHVFFIQPPDSSALFTRLPARENARPLRVSAPEHPLMRLIDVRGVTLRAFTPLLSDVLVPLWQAGDDGVLWAGERDGRRVLVLPFALEDSDLPLQLAFPLLMANAVTWFAPQQPISPRSTVTVGDALGFAPPLTADSVRVLTPDGRELRFSRNASTPVERVGLYALTAYEGTRLLAEQSVAVNVPTHDGIAPRPFTLGAPTDAPTPDATPQAQELWGVLVLLAMGLVLLEGWLSRRG